MRLISFESILEYFKIFQHEKYKTNQTNYKLGPLARGAQEIDGARPHARPGAPKISGDPKASLEF